VRILVSVRADPVDPSRLIVMYSPHPRRWRIEGKTVDDIVRELDETIAQTQARYRGEKSVEALHRRIQSELQVMIDSMQDACFIRVATQEDN
jgi:hypothetical protein